MISEECVEDISIKRPYFYTIKEYALSSTIHGIGYIFETNRLIFERLLWIIVLIVAVLIGTLLSIYTYKSWQDDPILTSVGTTGFPIEKIEFPSITICGQGYINEVVDAALYHQFKEYLKIKHKRPKRFSELASDELLQEGRSFLIDMYPGAKMLPNELVRIMASPNEEVDKIIKTESIYYPDTLIDNCASPDAQNESNVQITNRRKRYTTNKKAEECPDDSWWYNGYGSCVHYNPNLGRKKWSEATSYCESLGDNIGLFAVEDEGRGYSTLWDALHKEGKYIF